jgi:Flp pilus assembly pilin Flp
MRQRLWRFWQDETGTESADWAFVATILALGAITGAIAARQAAVERVGGAAPMVHPAR